MTPRALDPQIRPALIEAAARLVDEHGPDALTTRRLAAEVGTSTMAVYTHFEGMDAVRRAVAAEGFERLAGHLDALAPTADPVTFVACQGGAYLRNALANPHLYRFMFLERPSDDPEIGHDTFERLIEGVRRAVDAGRFQGDPESLATQLWAMSHGIITLHFAGLLELAEALECLATMGENLFTAFGDKREKANASITEAIELLARSTEVV